MPQNNRNYTELWKEFKKQHIEKPTIKDEYGYYHCVYVSRSPTRLYIGKHTCKKNPAKSKYLGSSTDKEFKKNVFEKVIIAYFKTSQEALNYELEIQLKYCSTDNPIFANKSHCTSHLYTGQGSLSHKYDNTVYTLYNSKGETVKGTRLELVELINCSYASICCLVNPNSRQKSANGYALSIEEAKKLDYPVNYSFKKYTLYNNKGESITGTQTELRNTLKIDCCTLRRLLNKKLKSVKGYALNIENANTGKNKIITLYKDGKKYQGTRTEICKKHKLDASGISKLILGKRKQYLGFSLAV